MQKTSWIVLICPFGLAINSKLETDFPNRHPEQISWIDIPNKHPKQTSQTDILNKHACFTNIQLLEIPASRVFLGANAQLLGTSLAEAKIPKYLFYIAQLYLAQHRAIGTKYQIFGLYFGLHYLQRSFFNELFYIGELSLNFDFSKHLCSKN